MKNNRILFLFVAVCISAQLKAQLNLDAGIIARQDSTTLLKESVVIADRMRGKAENDKTIFFMNNSILSASGSAPDVLRHIPGIQVDLKQNISLEGSTNILLFVNGKERDKSYISQLNPTLIDKIEILNTPPSNYEGSVTGVINIVLKKDINTGFSGQFFTELPTSKSIVYSFPTFNVQYGSEKWNLYTSYNGEINLEDIDETCRWQIREAGQILNITSVEQVRQKNLSHKIHYGLDYNVTPKDIISYYGSINPYSYEQDGDVTTDVNGDASSTWKKQREETDKNLNIFNSIYYKHLFNKEGREIAIDISNSHIKSSNSISYLNDADSGTPQVINDEKPSQVSTSIKVDFSSPLNENFMLNTGAKAEVKSMQNETAAGFDYDEQLYALYGTLNYKKTKFNLNFGLRAEYAESTLKNNFNKRKLSVLPYVIFQYKLNSRQNLLFTYRYSINRPSVFQLNPYTYVDNQFSVRKGNPLLEPEFMHRIYAEHSIRFNVSYISYRAFYERIGNVINNLTYLKDDASFETQLQNLGEIHQFGMQFSGSLKFGPVTISASSRLYNQSTSGNSLAKQYEIKNRRSWIFDANISSVVSFNHDFALSGTFQYSTVKNNIQDNAFSDALYIFSLDKTFRNNFKVGIMAALPFAKSFIYQQREVEAKNFSSSYSGNLNLPAFPIMLRLSYQFKIGKEKMPVYREREEAPKRAKTGL